jgi:hypothetical protein
MCECVGLRVDGAPGFSKLCTVPGSFGTISPEYWSSLHGHVGFASWAEAKRVAALNVQVRRYIDGCEAAAAAYQAAGKKLYSGDATFGSLRATLCDGAPVDATGCCSKCHALALEMAPGEGSIARRLNRRDKRACPHEKTNKRFFTVSE